MYVMRSFLAVGLKTLFPTPVVLESGVSVKGVAAGEVAVDGVEVEGHDAVGGVGEFDAAAGGIVSVCGSAGFGVDTGEFAADEFVEGGGVGVAVFGSGAAVGGIVIACGSEGCRRFDFGEFSAVGAPGIEKTAANTPTMAASQMIDPNPQKLHTAKIWAPAENGSP